MDDDSGIKNRVEALKRDNKDSRVNQLMLMFNFLSFTVLTSSLPQPGMPSLLTARTSGEPSTTNGRTFSRVTSFKREWNDDEPQPASSSQVPWSPSPERSAPLCAIYHRHSAD